MTPTTTSNLKQSRAILERFNRRFDESLAKAPPSKRWVRRALHRQGAQRCPVRLKRISLDLILRYPDEFADLFAQYPEDTLFAQAYEFSLGYRPLTPMDPIRALTESAEWTDEWGTVWHHSVDGVGASPSASPLTDWSQLDDYLARRMPDPREPGRLDVPEEQPVQQPRGKREEGLVLGPVGHQRPASDRLRVADDGRELLRRLDGRGLGRVRGRGRRSHEGPE